MQPGITRAAIAGALGTLAMTAVGLYLAPMMGMPAMNPADMLAEQMGGALMLGWAGHLMIGIILALIYERLAIGRLPGPGILRGALFSILPWLMAQLLVMPMMGMPLFSGSFQLALGSLLGHVVYGAVVGGILGNAGGRAPVLSEARL